MKIQCLILLVMLLASCNFFYNHIEISGSTPGIDKGDVIIKDEAGNVVFGEAIRSGKFHIPKQELKKTGYYQLYVPNASKPFEIYLEPGNYSITTRSTKPSFYPKIISSSKIQNELVAYHTVADGIFDKYEKEERKLINQINSPTAKLMSPSQYETLIDQVKAAQNKNNEVAILVLNEYLKRIPDNIVVAHILSNLNYEQDPKAFYKLYQKFSIDAKNSGEGIEIGETLSTLVKLLPGALAPVLAGKTPDNKILEFKAMNKKIIIVEFWRASLVPSRKNHQGFVNGLLPNFENKGVGIVSVSLDTKLNWWTTAIKDDKMNWPQVSDLNGFSSPNVTCWGINSIPMYYILDGSGHIIQRDVQYLEIPVVINSYLDAHSKIRG